MFCCRIILCCGLVTYAFQSIDAALLHPHSSHAASLNPVDDDNASLNGIKNLIQRRLPDHIQSFKFNLVPSSGDEFEISDSATSTPGITIQCTSRSACARGLYTYVKDFGGVDIWWTGSRLSRLASPLPKVGTPVKGSSIVDYRYYFNTVTFSYTTAFYNFDQWSLLLDWMALKGVNLPLAWVGYEYIYLQTLKQIGISEQDVISFFSGPAFQAWNRFGNIQGSWNGESAETNLPLQWINDQFTLQKRIIARMVELGMTPILPSFTGFLPCSVTTLHPSLDVVQGSQWSGFPSDLTNDCFLSPAEPLFTQIQKLFIQNQKTAYGNVTHMYTLDQYNENNPFSGNLSYLQNISSNTFQSLREADSQAIWIMQGWLFFSNSAFWTIDRISAYLGGVSDPNGMLILDLYSEAQPQWQRTSSYEGRPWIWCELHDYGQNQGFEGYLYNVTVAPLEALYSPNSTMNGVGLTMEGQEGNEIVYDILLDQAWSTSPLSIPQYVISWVDRRYQLSEHTAAGPTRNNVQAAWSLLSSTVYNNSDPNTQATVKSILELSPALTGLVNRTGHHPTEIFYDTNTTILPALKLLLQAKLVYSPLGQIPEFQYDAVDLTRQLLVNRFQVVYEGLVEQYMNSDETSDTLTNTAQHLQNILSNLDTLLYTNPNFLFSNWIQSAINWSYGGKNASYTRYLEYNARNQITLWGPTGQIDDYASKQWAGLVGTYYLPRWTMFTDYLIETKRSNELFNGTFISEQILEFGLDWDMRIWGENAGEFSGTRGDIWEVIENVLTAPHFSSMVAIKGNSVSD
ncbi:hypothetical protein Clacol_002250 [Clathrus columnatus]|uniref:Alpha-N-acetylglucosaminidase n=1 Tax=Clathrus columnatus TaxID=1419009 RepID=A0AAV5A3J4_9AGAM|nr:hypothetical protein Clacol_002250 [Clathrus columnatus]